MELTTVESVAIGLGNLICDRKGNVGLRYVVSIFAIFVSTSAVAQDWALREGDIPLSKPELQEFTRGVTLTYHDEGTSKFSPGGSYSYTYAHDGGTAFGLFRITEKGQVCIDFRNGRNRCDLYVRQDGLLIMLSSKGERFPVKVEMGLKR